jgi:sulfate adenylyltransferase subunit 1
MNAPDKLPATQDGLLRFLTCGSVDDGKSTLIGRLLYDTKAILADTLSAIEKTSLRKGLGAVDLSLLTDGLQAEREQGITIDVAYRYFTTGVRKYIIADAPGHEQYTRNMVTAASTANLALILVDARKGVVSQTRRHSYIAHLMGIPNLVVAVNKMDLVGFDEAVFEKIRADYLDFAKSYGIANVKFVPLSALNGDMVVERGDGMPWYTGATILEILESAPPAHTEQSEEFRFPVQYVMRPQASDSHELHDYRGFMGRVESGTVQVGDEVTVLPSGTSSRVASIELGGQSLTEGFAEQSLTIRLADEIDISRGDMIVHTQNSARVVKQLDAEICWLAEAPLDKQRKYIIRQTSREVKALVSEIAHRIDMGTLTTLPAETIAMNDIAKVSFKLAQALSVDAYTSNRATGAFIVIDDSTNNTVAAGMIL